MLYILLAEHAISSASEFHIIWFKINTLNFAVKRKVLLLHIFYSTHLQYGAVTATLCNGELCIKDPKLYD